MNRFLHGRRWRGALAVVALVAVGVLLGACSGGEAGSANGAADNVRRDASATANEVRTRVSDAWASLRSDGEQLIDKSRTSADPNAKADLLARCRDARDRLATNNPDQAGRVERFCNNVRDANPGDSAAWETIKREFGALRDALSQ